MVETLESLRSGGYIGEALVWRKVYKLEGQQQSAAAEAMNLKRTKSSGRPAATEPSGGGKELGSSVRAQQQTGRRKRWDLENKKNRIYAVEDVNTGYRCSKILFRE